MPLELLAQIDLGEPIPVTGAVSQFFSLYTLPTGPVSVELHSDPRLGRRSEWVGAVWVSKIKVAPEFRRQGLARRELGRVCEIADRAKVQVALKVHPLVEDGPGEDALCQF